MDRSESEWEPKVQEVVRSGRRVRQITFLAGPVEVCFIVINRKILERWRRRRDGEEVFWIPSPYYAKIKRIAYGIIAKAQR